MKPKKTDEPRYAQTVIVYSHQNRAQIACTVHAERAALWIREGRAHRVGEKGRIRAIQLNHTRPADFLSKARSTSGTARREVVWGAVTYRLGKVASFDEPLFRLAQLECMGFTSIRPTFEVVDGFGDIPVCVGARI